MDVRRGWLLRGRTGVLVAPEFTPVDRWSFALALRDEDRVLRRRLDRVIEASLRDGTLGTILTGYGVRFFRPLSGGPRRGDPIDDVRRSTTRPVQDGPSAPAGPPFG